MFKKIALLFGMVLFSGVSFADFNPVNIPTVTSITALRALPAVQYGTVYLTQYNSTTKQGGGTFTYSGDTSCSDNSGTIIQASGGCYSRNTNGQPYNVAWFGAQCGLYQVTDGVSTNTSHTVTSATSAWTSSMVGWVAIVNKAAASSKQLVTTVSGYTSAGSITLTAAAGASGTSETITLYPDDTTAIANTLSAAGTAGVSVTLPVGGKCGFANPGSHVTYGYSGPAIYLNGGLLALGQTGAVTDTGVSIEFTGDNSNLVGPGTVDGLYQTNQSISQFNASAIIWQHGAGIDYNSGIHGNVVIQNTKGRAVDSTRAYNFHVSDLTVQNCGDYQYVPGSGDPQIGRSMCAQFNAPSGPLSIKGFTAINAAQSGILISNSTDPQFHASISDCYFYGNGYYGLDVETNAAGGSVEYSNCKYQGNGGTVARGFTLGGAIFLNTDIIHGNNISAYGIDSNALVAIAQGPSSVLTDWSWSNMSVVGSAINHAGSIYIQFQDISLPERVSLQNVYYDSLQVVPTSSPACSTSNPMQQLFEFNNIHASHLYSLAAQTQFTPTASNNTSFLYVRGANSDLGTVNIAAGSNNPKSIVFDTAGVLQTGATTFAGGATGAATYQALGTANPTTSFVCP